MREGLAHESKRVDLRERLGNIGVGAQRGESAVSCHGYQKAPD